MEKRNTMLLAVGAGLAFYQTWKWRKHKVNAQNWATERANQVSPGTAFITGASSGIGEAFARALAREGYNLVLAARREERLRSLSEKLRRGNPVRVETLVVDLSNPADIERAASVVEEIPDLELLVNNAGFGMSGSFLDIDPQIHANMIRLHVEAPVLLTRAALPGMIERHRGGIINVSSVAALVPLPGSSTYGATKSYLNFFNTVLREELAGSGVRVQALVPGFTYSEFHDVAKVDRTVVPPFMWMPAHKVVNASLEGLREDRDMVIPGKLYKLMAVILQMPMMNHLARMVQERRLAMQEELL